MIFNCNSYLEIIAMFVTQLSFNILFMGKHMSRVFFSVIIASSSICFCNSVLIFFSPHFPSPFLPLTHKSFLMLLLCVGSFHFSFVAGNFFCSIHGSAPCFPFLLYHKMGIGALSLPLCYPSPIWATTLLVSCLLLLCKSVSMLHPLLPYSNKYFLTMNLLVLIKPFARFLSHQCAPG